MSAPLYTTEILRLATETARLARLPMPQGRATCRSPVCGSRVTVDVMLDDAGLISEIGAEPRACALGQASTAIMAGGGIGRSLDEIVAATDALKAYLAGEGDTPKEWTQIRIFEAARAHSARHAAICLPFEALRDAVAQARSI